jgi:hypothetical protein
MKFKFGISNGAMTGRTLQVRVETNPRSYGIEVSVLCPSSMEMKLIIMFYRSNPLILAQRYYKIGLRIIFCGGSDVKARARPGYPGLGLAFKSSGLRKGQAQALGQIYIKPGLGLGLGRRLNQASSLKTIIFKKLHSDMILVLHRKYGSNYD